MEKRRRLTPAERRAVYDKMGGRCAYCGEQLNYEDMQVDHVVALRSEGEDDLANMLPACRSCNHYKRGNSLEGWRRILEAMPATLERDCYTYRQAVRFGMVKLPLFEDATMVGHFDKAYVDDVEIGGVTKRCLVAEGTLDEMRYPKFVAWLRENMADSVVKGSVEIVGKPEHDGYISSPTSMRGWRSGQIWVSKVSGCSLTGTILRRRCLSLH